MPRIPAAASVTLAGLLPVCAAALGLGEIESKSFLNQPLAAEIPVFSEVPSEISGLNVSLASQDTFSQYGLQWPAFLGNLAFSVVPGLRGAVIHISSPQPVDEPFVTMLLEVRWPQGRLLREYTVLLDPPAFAGGAVRQPLQAPTSPAQPTAPVTTEAAPAAAEPAAPGDSDGTHTVARNETLWGIAGRYRPDAAADINQVMLAIYRANPDAFAGNINRLQAGAVLRLPDRAAVEGLRRGEADSEVQRQNLEWRGASAPTSEAPARLELVPPSATAAPARAPVASPAQIKQLESEAEESRRLLAVKDQELQALRNQVAQLQKQGGEVAVEEPPGTQPAAEPAPAPEQPAAAAPAAEKPAPAKPVRTKSVKAPESGILGTIGGLLTSIWLWVAAAIVLIVALLIARRRSAGEDLAPWRPPTTRGGQDDDADQASARRRGADDMIVIEEPGRAQATGGIERRAAPRGDEETPLERTISTEGPVNLDQSDPLAEADFHMAYGLYDQAADLLTAAMAREPARRDLHLKLLDVYFVWENREGFLKEAHALRERVGTDADPDWKRVIIMGKQLCPTEAMFAGAAAPAADEMDLALTADGGGTVDLPLGDAGGLDFDLSGDMGVDFDASASAKGARAGSSARTQEIATIEAPGMDLSSTMETPTIESPAISSTLETPTIETAMGERTLETPTVETTARIHASAGDERADQTEEIDLEDLGLDLTGLDDAARDLSTGLQEALPEDGGGLDFDISSDATSSEGEESTAEMEKNPTLKILANAMSKSDGGDTAEQPSAGDSMLTPGLSATSGELEALNIDLNLDSSESSPADLTATGLRALRARGPDDATMTEVGTKLDLARAYLDMGDPDGARSILNEVLEEGDPSQRQEARQLLDGLDG